MNRSAMAKYIIRHDTNIPNDYLEDAANKSSNFGIRLSFALTALSKANIIFHPQRGLTALTEFGKQIDSNDHAYIHQLVVNGNRKHMDDLRTILSTISDQYLGAKAKTFKGSRLANYVRHAPKKFLESYLEGSSIRFNYSVKASVGNGNWAIIPWIAVFDEDITNTVSRGIFIVYLFSEDMSSVYLTLDQGWTYFGQKFGTKIGRRKIKQVSNYWRENLNLITTSFSTSSIRLIDHSKKYGSFLPFGYEDGTILSVKYNTQNLPSNDKLLNDLSDMILTLEELKSKVISKENFALSTDYIIKQSEHTGESSEIKRRKFNSVKLDYQKDNETKHLTGLKGEGFVVQYEKRRLSKYPKLKKKIEQVSLTRGDGLSYDVLSFNEDGTKRFIEVKTTSSSVNTGFYVSENEVEFSKEYSSNYYLYRVYDINGATPKIEIMEGDISKYVNLLPTTYYAERK